MTPSIEPVTVSVASCVFTITGGASGIGAATARILARQEAAAVHIADCDTSKFKLIKDELEAINPHAKVFTEQVDVSSSSSVRSWIQGVVMSDPSSTEPIILRERDEEIESVININYKGVVYCTREQTAAMLNLPKGSHPSIVNITSCEPEHIPGGYTYSAS
ncbi:chanoclavine-I dehydrogenase [Fusarium austroafricanum]|uniref:Chanoclavine-I dehydrogenase n=1 Tax=Fusarium austroafricanum TaxID=2364996 RepID=A0A8H4NIK2_9HYPO|nr:chanoclavine-I dehydrogenase [Fusarium austroafricanum]